ncbi:outer membrane protein assembly factor BamA [Robertkochia sediminum]|uniref:outer membrane protein assembly factor BamA n=1 Tax=Robertkochia sediminum TaxID=2785326 RepID=UPI001931BC58|nr:outer membrane protein assembly factor BamA [Robertkochia sediminum]MBL7472412.1 outer membrane protein assembly factor BamA [Robertkochia sediminum]
MLKRFLSVFFVVLFTAMTTVVTAQDTSYEQGKTYTLGGLEVTGLKSFNEQTVLTFTGLRVGQEITIPGEDLSEIINRLWGLRLFSDINFYQTRIEGDKIFLELEIVELPTLTDVKIKGVKERKAEAVLKEADVKKGEKVTEGFLSNTRNYLVNKYKKEGYLNTKVNINTIPDTTQANGVKMVINVDTGEKVKINDIQISGNEKLNNAKVKKSMKNTKEKFFGRFWKKSKFIPEDYQEDLKGIVNKYKENGYRDARIVSDSIIYNDDNTISIAIDVEEGSRYYFGDIDFVGNAAYTDAYLQNLLGIGKGEVYNGVLLAEQVSDPNPDANTIENLYQNTGYLFSSINTVEVAAVNDTIDFEIRVNEGKQAYLNRVDVIGNDKTNDHVIYRELRTRPGQLYSKDRVVRTIRELGQMGFFDPESIDIQVLNPNPQEGTVDLQYGVQEQGSSQIELQGGYGGGGFIGTLGLSFNNFAIKDLFNKDAYKPIPMGDGQRLSLRLQASRFFQTYSFSFSEPWWGGKKPVQFSVSLSRTLQFQFNPLTRDVDRDQRFAINGVTLGLAKRLRWPDDSFQLSHALTFQQYELKNYFISLFPFPDGNGNAKNFAYTVALTRNNTSVNPIFPMSGSQFNISLKLTPPYSLFNGVDYANLENDPEYQTLNEQGEVVPDEGKISQKKLDWLEFYKIKFTGAWYTNIIEKLVLKSGFEFGFLGAYNQDRGVIPFERFFLGGDGLGNFTLDGRENIQLRGYPNQQLSTVDGSAIYNKFSLELRYPITLKPSASIYALGFAEGGAGFDDYQQYNPFELKRSAGLGIRIFMPAFGLLGIDFGYGFDRVPGEQEISGWQTHFIIGQQF